MKRNLLIAVSYAERKEFDMLKPYAELFWLDDTGEKELEGILPVIDCLYVQHWPPRLDSGRLSQMSHLEFIQSDLAGVNQIPFGSLRKGVIVSSNAGGYSEEVGEFAWALLLTAAKKVVKFDRAIQQRRITSMTSAEGGKQVKVLAGKTLGVVGYGGIGRRVATYGRDFGMKIVVYSRSSAVDDAESVHGRDGLRRMLPVCDALVLALPLTNLTRDMIGRAELEIMRADAILVNVARGELVNGHALYEHLKENKDFTYATDVWWYRDGRESFPPDFPYQELENFIGTPHASGPSAVVGNGPLRRAVQNILRFLKGESPMNVVDRKEYT